MAADRARIGAVALDWAGIVKTATPWAELVAQKIIREKFGDLKAAEKTPEKPKATEKSPAESASKVAAKADDKTAGEKDKPKKAKAKKGDGKKKASPAAEIMDQVHTVLNVLQVVRSATAETYRDGNAVVNHSMVEIRDLK